MCRELAGKLDLIESRSVKVSVIGGFARAKRPLGAKPGFRGGLMPAHTSDRHAAWLRRGLAVALVAFVLLNARLAQAYRPFDGTDAAVAEHGAIELEVGPAGYLREEGRSYLVIPAWIANYGFHDGFELVAEAKSAVRVTMASDEPRARLIDAALSIKEVLRQGSLQGRAGLSVANEWSVLLPDTSSDQQVGAALTTIFSHSWSIMTVHLNVMNELSRSHRYVAWLDPIIEGPLGWPLRPVTELTLSREFRSAQLRRSLAESALIGFIGRLNETTTFDAALRTARASGVLEQEIRVGFTCRL